MPDSANETGPNSAETHCVRSDAEASSTATPSDARIDDLLYELDWISRDEGQATNALPMGNQYQLGELRAAVRAWLVGP